MRPATLLAICWTLAILAACSLPGNELPKLDFDLFEPDKIAHFILFFLFGFLWLAATPAEKKGRRILIAVLGTLYAILTEFYQSALPLGRTADPMDSVANLIGLFTAMGSYSWLRARIWFLNPKTS